MKACCREDWWRVENCWTLRLFWPGCRHKSHAGVQDGSGDLSVLRKIDGASRADEEPARGLLSLCKPSNVLLPCARGMQQQAQHISGLRHVWLPPLRAFVLLLIFQFRGCDSNHISSPERLFHYVWRRRTSIPKMSDESPRLNRVYKFKWGRGYSFNCGCHWI